MRLARLALAITAALVVGLVPASVGSATPPTINVVVTAGTAGKNGWWVTNITVNFELSGSITQILQGCGLVNVTSEGVKQLDCKVTGPEGTAEVHPVFRIDKTPPAVTSATPSRAPDANGWYNAPLSVSFAGSDGVSGIAGCSGGAYTGPDARAAGIGGSCTDVAGHVTAAGFALKYDSTPPEVNAAPERQPDANGWYNKPVKLLLSGGDSLSGLESCDAKPYAGPDASPAALTGSCRDAAGNTTAKTISIRYDGTAPKVGGVKTAFGNRAVTLSWAASKDAAAFTVRRKAGKKGAERTVYQGRSRTFTDHGLTNGVRYRYTVLGADQAGNVAATAALATPRALIAPVEGARLRSPPKLTWFAAPKASYYNVQIFRGRLKVLSIWPAKPFLKMKRAWTYEGRRFKLVPGRYRWYVFPGFGARRLNRYGALLGGSTFRITR
jgi:hypothetical protein